MRRITLQDISVNIDDLRKRLIPLLKRDKFDKNSILAWTENIVMKCQEAFKRFLPLTTNEIDFLNLLLEKGKIEPQLITDDIKLIENIKQHPAIVWSATINKN